MNETLAALLSPGKGMLAADESFPTIGKRFATLGIEATEDTRRAYREMLFTAEGLGDFISGVILFDETLRQRTRSAAAILEIYTQQGIVPGIKVDTGAKALAALAGKKITLGLNGLRERLAEYQKLGARFTKWRAVITVNENLPTRTCIKANAWMVAMFAALSQEARLVPIVEPEVLMNGKHSIARCEEVTTLTLKAVFDALVEYRIVLEQMILKTGMVLSGAECPEQAEAEAEAVAHAILRCLRRTVHVVVPGVVFLSGGQSDEASTQKLNAIYRRSDVPLKMTFSFGRALRTPAMNTWKGSSDNVVAAQKVLYHRAQCNSAAIRGKYSAEMEMAGLSLPERDHV